MTYRRLAWALVAVVVAVLAAIMPVQAHGQPPTKCLTNTQTGKQVYVPCDLLNAGANFPPGQRCPPPLEQYPKDVADWCGVGPGLATPTPTPTSAPPTSPTSPTSPTPTSSARPTTSATSTTTPTATSPTTPTTPATSTSPTSPVAPGDAG